MWDDGSALVQRAVLPVRSALRSAPGGERRSAPSLPPTSVNGIIPKKWLGYDWRKA